MVVILLGTFDLKLKQGGKTRRHPTTRDLGFCNLEPLQVLLWNVHPTSLPILADVTPKVAELHRD